MRSFFILFIVNTQIGDEGAKEIGDSLKNNTNLLTLDLCNIRAYVAGNSIESDGAKGIAQGLKCNHALKELILRIGRIKGRLEQARRRGVKSLS